MAKKKRKLTTNDFYCLNCKQPFIGSEKFCSECGQKNKGRNLKLNDFMREVFAGFFSWDAKFWRTLIPLLTRPGKISKDYIHGKRVRFTNPFRFFFIISVIFFFLAKLNSRDKLSSFGDNIKKNQKDSLTGPIFNYKEIDKEDINKFLNFQKQYPELDINTALDSLNAETNSKNKSFYEKIKKINELSEKTKKDSLTSALLTKTEDDIDKYLNFQKKHPELDVDIALDSLNEEHTFTNRLLYKKSKTLNEFSKDDKKSVLELLKLSFSYLPTTLLLLLPVFAFVLKVFYIRRKLSYMNHLIFIFHIATFFFIFLTFFQFILLFPASEAILDNKLFTILPNVLIFGVYPFVAMKTFYQQGYLKTFMKLFCISFVFIILLIITMLLILALAFLMM